uniref:Uncharacterized protein n=1 Tax=Anopheles melas TaxID=34690 RepID=A0A182UFU9_9DIPT
MLELAAPPTSSLLPTFPPPPTPPIRPKFLSILYGLRFFWSLPEKSSCFLVERWRSSLSTFSRNAVEELRLPTILAPGSPTVFTLPVDAAGLRCPTAAHTAPAPPRVKPFGCDSCDKPPPNELPCDSMELWLRKLWLALSEQSKGDVASKDVVLAVRLSLRSSYSSGAITATGRGPSSEHMSELARISGLPPTIGAHSTADAEGRAILCTPTQKLLLRANLSERGVKSSSVSPAASVRRIFSVRSPDRSVSPLSVIDERRRLFVTVLEELAPAPETPVAAGGLPLSSVAVPRTGENNERFDFNTRASENNDRSSCLLLLPARSFRDEADEVPPFCGLRNRARLDDSRVAGTCTWEHDLPPAATVMLKEQLVSALMYRSMYFKPNSSIVSVTPDRL